MSRRADRSFGAGLGLATAAAVSAGSAAAQGGGGAPTAAPFARPHHQISPSRRFRVSVKPWPGLARDMTPKPDHGETSYKGSGRLAGRKALITGGDSGMGRAAAIAFAREGADVAIGYLPFEEPDAQRGVGSDQGRGPYRRCRIPGDIRSESLLSRKWWQSAVRELGGLDILVNNAASVNRAHASIMDITSDNFDWTIKTNIYAPFWIDQGGAATPEAGFGDHRHHLGAGLRPLARPL